MATLVIPVPIHGGKVVMVPHRSDREPLIGHSAARFKSTVLLPPSVQGVVVTGPTGKPVNRRSPLIRRRWHALLRRFSMLKASLVEDARWQTTKSLSWAMSYFNRG